MIDWIQQFQLWDTSITAWCRQIKFDDMISTYRNKYRNVFDISILGLYTKAKVHIKLLPDAEEVYIPKRPVPYAARADIETELQRLESNGTISTVDTSRSNCGQPSKWQNQDLRRLFNWFKRKH